MTDNRTPAQQVAALCIELDGAVSLFKDQIEAAAVAESEYKKHRAKRILQARVDGEKAISSAEYVADADDLIADLRQAYLIAEGISEATKHRLRALTERIGFGRSLIANEREQDRLHSQNRNIP